MIQSKSIGRAPARRGMSVALSAAMLAAVAGTARGQVAWRTAPDVALSAAMTGAEAGASLRAMAARDGERHIVVELGRNAGEQDRAALAAAGITLLAPVGASTYFAAVDAAQLDADAAFAVAGVRSVRAINPDWKMHPLVAADTIPSYALVAEGFLDASAAEPGAQRAAVYVVFHGDVPLDEGSAILAQLGAIEIDRVELVNAIVAEVPRLGLHALAELDAVQWVEPALPQFTELNAENRTLTQVNTVEFLNGLLGTGVRVMVYDGGSVLAGHQGFNNGVFSRVTVRDNSFTSDHATHVAGTIGGSGAGSQNGQHRGMAPGVMIDSFGFQVGGGDIPLYSNPGDLEADYTTAITQLGDDISNNSIGTNTSTNGFPCEITGDYGVTCSLIDTIVRGGLGEPFRVVWANGNERQVPTCGDTFFSTAPPATAKNHLTVGAINANDESMTDFSSWGPTDDGRLKPDVAAPGCQSDGDGGVTSCSASGGYNTKCGTSMASPTVCGISALVIQSYRAKYPSRPDFRNSTLRALLAHTAAELGRPGPDYQFGYGSVRAKDAIDHVGTGSMTEGSVGDGGSSIILVEVEPGQPLFKATLAWDDAPATPNVAVALVNQLDLVVTDPGGARHFPWTLNPADPSADAERAAENTIDNIEQVFVENPIPGTWTVEVRGTSIPEGPQPFSVVATPDLTSSFISIVSGPGDLAAPGEPITIGVSIDFTGQALDPGSAILHYRLNPQDAFSEAPLAAGPGSLYFAQIPAPLCGQHIEYYASAAGTALGAIADPGDAPASVYSAAVGEVIITADDAMESDSGWTVGGTGDNATAGHWNRMDPQGTAAQPGDDHSPAGTMCWITDGNAGAGDGSFDIDNGQTTLTSPNFDLEGAADPVLSYWRWFSNDGGAAPNDDPFIVEISGDGGASWSPLETVGPAGAGTSGGWVFAEFHIADFAPLTSQVRIRFIAADNAPGSLVEAAIDDLRIDDIGCDFVPPVECTGDLTGDLVVDSSDLNTLLAVFGLAGSMGDVNGDGVVNSTDLNLLLANFGEVCE